MPELINPQDIDLVGVMERVLARFGFNPDEESFRDTPTRWVNMMREMTTPDDFAFTVFPNTGVSRTTQMVVVQDIEFSSLCAHHCLPYHGVANIGYIPAEKIVGVSKIPRLVEMWAKRPMEQERLGQEILDDLNARLEPQGVIVQMKAIHTCMKCRGVESSAKLITCVATGILLVNPYAKQEFIDWVTT